MPKGEVPEVSLRQLEYVKGLEDQLTACHARIQQLEAAWARRDGACPYVATSDEGTSFCTLAEGTAAE